MIKKIMTIVVLVLTGVMMLIGICGCYTQRSAQKQLDKVRRHYPAVLANDCGQLYPPTDSISVSREIIPGRDIVVVDTAWHTGAASEGPTKYITKVVRRADTIRDTRYVQVENKAALAAAGSQTQKLERENHLLLADKRRYKWWLWVLGGAWALLVAYKVVRLYLGGKR